MSLPRRRVGTSELDVSVLSLGSWHTYDRMDFADAVTMIRTAVSAGINLFDVGVYGMPGMPPVFTDVLWGAIMRASGIPRDEYLVSAKLWIEGFGSQGFRPQLENAFLRGGFDVADLVILGDLRRDDIDLAELVEDLGELTRAGLIRAWGVNNWSATNIRRLRTIAKERALPGPQIAQLKYSVARRSIPDGGPFAELFADGFGMQASDVLEGGILTGRTDLTREVGRDPGGIRPPITTADVDADSPPSDGGSHAISATNSPTTSHTTSDTGSPTTCGATGGARDAIGRSTAGLVALAKELGTSAARLAVAFTLTHPANVTTLFGATRVEQVKDNLAAVDLVERVGAGELRKLVEPLWADRGIVDPEGP